MNIKITNDGACAFVEVTAGDGSVLKSVNVEANQEVTLTALADGGVDVGQVCPTGDTPDPAGEAGQGNAEGNGEQAEGAEDAADEGQGEQPDGDGEAAAA